MTQTSSTPTTKFQMYNDLTRRYEDIDLDDAEILPGQTVVKLYWLNSAQTYATVPGASLYRMNANFELVLES